jgi:hypothetical protein
MAMTMREISAEILKGMEDCNLSKSTIKDYSYYLGKFTKQAKASCRPGLYSWLCFRSVLNLYPAAGNGNGGLWNTSR